MPAPKPAADFVPTGDWLFRQAELTLGPIKGGQLVEKLYAGEVTGQTAITPLGKDSWRPLRDVEGFKLHLAKAEAKLRVDVTRKSIRTKATRQRNTRIGVVATVAVLVAGGMAVGGRYLAVHRPWHTAEVVEADITVEPPKIALATRGHGGEELLSYPSEHGGGGGGGLRRAGGKSIGGHTRTESDGMEVASFDQSAINAVVTKYQKSLYPCFVEEAKRSPELTAKIPIEFVIGNEGRVAKLWVDEPSLKQGPLADCLLRELQKWPFSPYPGERATVALSFQIGKHKS